MKQSRQEKIVELVEASESYADHADGHYPLIATDVEGDAGRAGGDALSQTEKSLSGKLREKIVVFSMFHRANLL